MVLVLLSHMVPATAPWMSTGPCGLIAATLDVDIAPLVCFGGSLAFSGCCIWETFPAKWLIHHLLPFGLQRKCGSFLCNLCLPGQHHHRFMLQNLTVHISHQKITASPSQSTNSSGTPWSIQRLLFPYFLMHLQVLRGPVITFFFFPQPKGFLRGYFSTTVAYVPLHCTEINVISIHMLADFGHLLLQLCSLLLWRAPVSCQAFAFSSHARCLLLVLADSNYMMWFTAASIFRSSCLVLP